MTHHITTVRASLALLAAALATPGVSAQEAAQASSVYGVFSAFGLGVGYAHRTSEHWVSRIQLNSGGLVRSRGHTDIGDVHYDTRVRTGAGLSTLTDYYPSSSSGFHLTGGLVWSRLNPELTGQPDGQGGYRINHHSYSAAEVGTLKARLKYDPVNLYLGGGWESAPITQPGWRFVSDVGLFSPLTRAKATLTATGAAGNAALQADLDAERDALRKRGLGVSVSLGAAYSF
jgi:opacity protein-like surface antigen